MRRYYAFCFRMEVNKINKENYKERGVELKKYERDKGRLGIQGGRIAKYK